MKKSIYKYDYAFRVDIGKIRINNEDRANILVNKHNDVLMLVADGMGGHNKGEYASKLTIDSISEAFKKHTNGFFTILSAKLWLQSAASEANKIVYDTAEKSIECKGMGTTLVAILIHKKNIIVLNAGDSRAYIYQDDKLKHLSEDQSYVEYLKRSGQISEKEAEKRDDKNVLLNALGIYPSLSYDSRLYKYQNGSLLLCSDGLFNNLKEKDILVTLKKSLPAKETVDELINFANKNGGSDNIAVAYLIRKLA